MQWHLHQALSQRSTFPPILSMGCGASVPAGHQAGAATAEAAGINETQSSNLSACFSNADGNRNSTLEYEEFLAALDLEDGRLSKNFFAICDKDDSGGLNFEEFASTLSKVNRSFSRIERLQWTYQLYDRDKSGDLAIEEIFVALNDPNVNLKFPKARLSKLFPQGKGRKKKETIDMVTFVKVAEVQPLIEMPVRMLAAKISAYALDYEKNALDDIVPGVLSGALDKVIPEKDGLHRQFSAQTGELLAVGATEEKYVVKVSCENAKAEKLAQRDARLASENKAREDSDKMKGAHADKMAAERKEAEAVIEAEAAAIRQAELDAEIKRAKDAAVADALASEAISE